MGAEGSLSKSVVEEAQSFRDGLRSRHHSRTGSLLDQSADLLTRLAALAEEDERVLHEIWEWACGIDLGDGSRRRLHETLQPLYERWGYGPFVDEVLAGVSAERGEQR